MLKPRRDKASLPLEDTEGEPGGKFRLPRTLNHAPRTLCGTRRMMVVREIAGPSEAIPLTTDGQ
jgi:hypothetical protein